MPRSPGRTGHQWRKVREIVLSTFDACYWCGQWVDKSLSGRDPMGPTVEHLDPIAMGGDPLDIDRLRLAHLRCNVARGNRLRARNAKAAGPALGRPRRSREW